MIHLLCCLRNGELPHRDFTPTGGPQAKALSQSPESVKQPELDPKTLQPKIVRTPEKLRKSPPKKQSPMKKIVKTPSPSPVKRKLFHGITKSRSKSKVSAAEMEALYREGVEMLMLEQGHNDGGGGSGSGGKKKKLFKRHSQMFSISSFAKPRKPSADNSSLLFGTSYDKDKSAVHLPNNNNNNHTTTITAAGKPPSDWGFALELGPPNKEPEKQSKTSSEFGAEIVIPIRRSSRGFSPVDSTPFTALTPRSTATSPKTASVSTKQASAPHPNDHSPLAHKRLSSVGTELALDLAPDAIMSQLCLDFLESTSLRVPEKPLLRPYEMPSLTSSFADEFLSTPLRKVSSALSSRVHSRAPSSDYGSDPGLRVLRHSRSDTLRRSSWGKSLPVPVPTTQEKCFFRSHRDNGLVSTSAHADGTPAYLASGLKELANATTKDLSPIKEVNSPQRTPQQRTPVLDHITKTLAAWKLGQDTGPATPTSVMLESIDGERSPEQVAAASTNEIVDGSSSRYPSQPPSRHDSCFHEFTATPSKDNETPPLPVLDRRITSQIAAKNHLDTPIPPRPRSYSIGATSTKSTSSVKDSIVRRSFSKLKKGFSSQKASEPETIIPTHIPMFPDTTPTATPLRYTASTGTLGGRSVLQTKASGTTLTTVESYKTAKETLRRANSIGTITSVRSSEGQVSPGSTVRRSSFTVQIDRASRTRSMSMFSDDSYYSPSQSPCPRDTGGSWTRLYDDCVSNPFASHVSVNRRTIDFQNMNVAFNGMRSATASPADNNNANNNLTTGDKDMQAKLRPKSCNSKPQSVDRKLQ